MELQATVMHMEATLIIGGIIGFWYPKVAWFTVVALILFGSITHPLTR